MNGLNFLTIKNYTKMDIERIKTIGMILNRLSSDGSVSILKSAKRNGTMNATQIQVSLDRGNPLRNSQSQVSRVLRTLRIVGLMEVEKDGKFALYENSVEKTKELNNWIEDCPLLDDISHINWEKSKIVTKSNTHGN